jgi:TPR repeat protein
MLNVLRAGCVLQVLFQMSLLGIFWSAQMALAHGEPSYAREFKGAVELDATRVLAWEFVSDGTGTMPLWIFEEGRGPRQVGKLPAEEITAAVGGGSAVFVADRRLWRTDAKNPEQPTEVELSGQWLSVVHGQMGFVTGGGRDAMAISNDGRTWSAFKFKASDGGDIVHLASNGTELLVVRQIFEMSEGEGKTVSELSLSSDGKVWRPVARFEGGSDYVAVEAMAWAGDRWLGHGLGMVVELMPDGKSRRIASKSDDGATALLADNVTLFRDGSRWVLTSDASVLVSDDLADWKQLSGASSDDISGRWFAAHDGSLRLVGSIKYDWSEKQVFTLAALVNPPAKANAPTVAAPRGTVLAGGGPRGPETVYHWPTIMASAVKRAAAEPPRVIDESVRKRIGTKKTKWSKGSPWKEADMIAAFRKGATAREIVTVMGLDYDGSDLDKRGILTVLTSPEWDEALRKSRDSMGVPDRTVEVELWAMVKPRSVVADALAREVIAHRRKDVPIMSKPVDSPELRQRVAAGEAEAAYHLYLLYYGVQSDEERRAAPSDLPSGSQLIAQATQGYAPAQWLLASQAGSNSDKVKNDPVRVFELYWTSAMAGDAHGAFKLAKLFAAPNNDYGVARNYAEAEYWLIEAAVRGWPRQMDQPYHRPWLELANLYSAQSPNDVMSTMMPTYEDATARWLRLMTDRGGVMAEYAQLAIRYFDQESRRDPTPFNYAKRISTISAERPVLSAEEWRKVEASAVNRATDLLRVADAYAGGREVRQNDVKAVAFYHRAVQAGAGLPAYRALMHHYRNGFGVKKDMAQFLVWLAKAASTNDVASLLELGDALHYTRQGITPDYPAALVAYEKAAAQGEARALYSIGIMHRYGRGGREDEVKWREFTEAAAAKGHTRAMADIASSYIDNKVPWNQRNFAEAAVWYRKAVDAGDLSFRFALAEALQNSDDAVGAQIQLLEVVADEPHHVQSLYKLGQMAEWAGRRDEAARWYREVAQLDTIYDFMKTDAQRFILEYDEEESAEPGSLPHYRKKAKIGTSEDMFAFAMRLPPSQRAQAERWLGAAAEKGHALATTVAYEWKAQNDKAAAEKWIRLRAGNGNSQAVLMVGLLTAATDKAAGLALVRQAAEAGNLDAIFRIGMMQYQGNELPLDRAAGVAGLSKAADGGFPLAQLTLGRALLTGDVDLPAAPQRAISYLKRALEQEYAGAVALQAAVLLGQVYEGGQIVGVKADLLEAVRAYERATKLDPKNTQLLNHYHNVQRRLSVEVKMR